MNYADLFKEELVLLKLQANSKEEVIRKAANDLLDKQFVTNEFHQAVMKRERNYPTGLHLEHINIAIPHTDIHYIKKPFVYVCKLETKVPFIQMGSVDEEVLVEAVLVLGINEPKEQVGMLSGLMEVFNDERTVNKFKRKKEASDVVKLLQDRMSIVKL